MNKQYIKSEVLKANPILKKLLNSSRVVVEIVLLLDGVSVKWSTGNSK